MTAALIGTLLAFALLALAGAADVALGIAALVRALRRRSS